MRIVYPSATADGTDLLQVPRPRCGPLGLRMLVVAAVLRCGLIRTEFIESPVVMIDPVTCWTTNDQVIRIAQVADQRSHCDVDNIISKAPAIGPSTRNKPTILERVLNVALEHVAAEDAQP